MGLVGRVRASVVVLAVLPSVLEAQPATAVVKRSPASPAVAIADSLLGAGDLPGSYAVLAARLAEAPDDYEARWRATRSALGMGIVGTTHEARRTWLRVADAHGRDLLRLRPNTPDAMAWAAAARGRRALGEDGMRTVARLAKETWILTGRILALEPDHALANEVRGKAHQEAARMPTVTRFFARMLMGNALMDEASRWDMAERHLLRAIASDPGLVMSYLDLGESYGYQRKWTEAEATYRRGLAVRPRYPVDEKLKSIMRERLAALPSSSGGR